MLGATQDDAIRIFQSITVGDSVPLTVCRGYPLLFDPHGDIRTLDMRTNSMQRPARDSQRITLSIVKSGDGFGFTIEDSPHGQRVRTVVNGDRCPGLEEGDQFVEINGVNVRAMSHPQLVGVLRECGVGERATIVVHRETQAPGYGSRGAPVCTSVI